MTAMNSVTATRLAAARGFLAVALGAFGAHGLGKVLADNGTTEVWKTAVLYHFIHAVMLFVLAQRPSVPRWPWWSFLIGIVLFSGSLYGLALASVKWLGPITPLGGLSFLLGWGWLVWTGLRAGNAGVDK
jgi:uncharacterized membrane protein YgdD (TMEM256/DUF423 family)